MVAQERLLVDAVEEHGRRPLDGLVQDRERQRIPEQAPRRVALARAVEVLGERQPLRPAPEAHGQPQANPLQLDGERHAQPRQAGEQVQRRRERRAVERARAALVDPLELQLVLHLDQLGRSGAAQQVERRGVRAHHHVRAVVDVVAGDRVAGRGGAAAENAAALEQHDLVAPLLERRRGGEAREAAADHDDLHAPKRTRSSVRAAIQSLRGLESAMRGPPTGKPRLAHVSSTAR